MPQHACLEYNLDIFQINWMLFLFSYSSDGLLMLLRQKKKTTKWDQYIRNNFPIWECQWNGVACGLMGFQRYALSTIGTN